MDRQAVLGLLFVAPSIAILVVLVLFPLCSNVVISLSHADLLHPEVQGWAGLDNYVVVLNSESFIVSFENTMIWTFGCLFVQFWIGMVLAVLLDAPFRGRAFIRGMLILPWAVPTVVVAFVFIVMLDPTFGPLNTLLMQLRLISSPINFFNPGIVLSTVMAANIWRDTPFMLVCFMAGLQTIPTTLYESAKVDGASRLQQFWHVTLPGLKHVILIVLVLNTIWLFNRFDLVYLMTGGGPVWASRLLSVEAMEKGFYSYRLDIGAATSVIMALILCAMAFVYFRYLYEE